MVSPTELGFFWDHRVRAQGKSLGALSGTEEVLLREGDSRERDGRGVQRGPEERA